MKKYAHILGKKINILMIGAVVTALFLLGGLAAVLYLSSQSQEIRNQAAVDNGMVSVSTKSISAAPVVGQPYSVDVYVAGKGINIDGVQLIGNFTSGSVESVRFESADSAGATTGNFEGRYPTADQQRAGGAVYNPDDRDSVRRPTPASTAFRLVKQSVSADGVQLVFTLRDANRPFTVSGETKLGTLVITPAAEEEITLDWDPTQTKATIYKTGKDTLVPPQPVSISFSDIATTNPVDVPTPTPTSQVVCKSNAECGPNEECYQPPMPPCPAGAACAQVMPRKVCRTVVAVGPSPSPTTTTCQYDREGNPVCPQFDLAPGFCADGELVPQPKNACGCAQPPVCRRPDGTPTPTPTTPTKVTPSPSVSPSPSSTPKPTYSPSPSPTTPTTSKPTASPWPRPTAVPTIPCTYTYTDWSACRYGVQSRAAIRVVRDPSCVGSPEQTVRTCVSASEQCQSNDQCGAGLECSNSQCVPVAQSYDVNSDGRVNVIDLALVSKNLFGNNLSYDVNADDIVDIVDYSLMLRHISVRRPGIGYPSRPTVRPPVTSPTRSPQPGSIPERTTR